VLTINTDLLIVELIVANELNAIYMNASSLNILFIYIHYLYYIIYIYYISRSLRTHSLEAF